MPAAATHARDGRRITIGGIMSEEGEQPEAADLARAFLLRVLLLAFAMGLSYLLLDGYSGPIGAATIIVVYVFGGIFVKGRGKSGEPKAPGGFRVWLAATIFFVSGFMAVTGIAGAVIIAWLRIVYTPFESEGVPATLLNGDVVGGLPYILAMLAGGVVFLALGVLLLHWGRGGLGVLAGRLRRHGLGLFLSPWLNEIAMLLLLTLGSSLFVISMSLEILIDQMSFGRSGGFLAMIEVFPFLALGLTSVAVLAVALVSLIRDYTLFEDIVRVLCEDDAAPVRRDAWWPALVTITLGGAAGILGSMLWGLHVALPAAAASVPALEAGRAVGGELNIWVIEMRGIGRGPEEMAAMVNENGFWRPTEPNRGLVELMPGLTESLTVSGPWPGCIVTVAAAAATPEDAARPIPDISDWRPLIDGQGRQETEESETAENQENMFRGDSYERSPLRYCVKVTCPVPVVWDAPPAVSLYSSHPSDRPDWMMGTYFDLDADGLAESPGGYCTETGKLADEFQG
jgi:hypothetical protein